MLLRIDTPIEVDYYKHGGILPYVLRELIGKAGPAKAMSFFQKPAPWGTGTEPCTWGRLGAGAALRQPSGDGLAVFRVTAFGILTNQNIDRVRGQSQGGICAGWVHGRG